MHAHRARATAAALYLVLAGSRGITPALVALAENKPPNRLRRTLLPITLAVTTCIAVPAFAAEQATPADMFVDSVGVNIHLSYMDTLYYTDFALVSSSLHTAGVRHVRDGFLSPAPALYYERQRVLAAEGIMADLIVPPVPPAPAFSTALHNFAHQVESFEAPNEFDRTGASWSQRLLPILREVSSAAAREEPTVPVIGPSLTQADSYKQSGDLSAYSNFGNLHNYFGGHNPGTGGWGDSGYGSIAWNLKNVAITNPGQPVITTETGYTNQASSAGSVPETIAARYLPRLLLEQWIHGIHRTYLYELLSSGGEDFGLLRADGSPKPAFHAVANLMQLLKDPGPGFAPHRLEYTISGAPPDLHRALFEKRDGTVYLALWVEASGYDVNAKIVTPVPAQEVSITLKNNVRNITAIAFHDTGSTSSHVLAGTHSFRLVVGDRLTVVRIMPFPRHTRTETQPYAARDR